MRVMVFAIITEGAGAPEPPTPEAFEAMDRYTEELVEAGVFIAGAGLKPTEEGKRILFDGVQREVVDGPFTETKEVVAGFSIWEVKDMDEAVAWARRSPNPMPGRSRMELRPFYEAADFADLISPEELAAPRDGERGSLGVA